MLSMILNAMHKKFREFCFGMMTKKNLQFVDIYLRKIFQQQFLEILPSSYRFMYGKKPNKSQHSTRTDETVIKDQ